MGEQVLLGNAVLPWFIAGVGVLGLLIGSFLNVVIWRVPRGESLLPDSHCPQCDAPIRPWQNVPVVSWLALRGKCRNCKARISVRYPLVELATALSFALIAWWAVSAFPLEDGATVPQTFAWWLMLGAYLWFGGAGIALLSIDLEHLRLPDAIVVPSLAVILALLGIAAALQGDWSGLLRLALGAASMFLFYFLIVLVYPKGMGGGDVKLAPVIGAALGFIGWPAVIVGGFAGFLLGAISGLSLIAARRANRKTGIPFGPFMLIGAWVGILFGEPVVQWYLKVVGLSEPLG